MDRSRLIGKESKHGRKIAGAGAFLDVQADAWVWRVPVPFVSAHKGFGLQTIAEGAAASFHG